MQRLRLDETIADGTLYRRKTKGGADVGRTMTGKGTKIMLRVDIASANHPEATLIEPPLEQRFANQAPESQRLSKAAESDSLRERLRTQQIELAYRHRANRHSPPEKGGRRDRRLSRRWRVVRRIAGLQSLRRFVTRYEDRD